MRSVLLRFVAAALVLGSGALAFQDQLVDAAMPLFRAWLDRIDTTYRTLDLSIARVNGEAFVQRVVTPARPHVVGERIVYSDPRTRVSSQAAAGIVLQPWVLGAALLIAWPWRSIAELAVRFALAAPLMLLVMLLDVPTMLYAVAWSKEVSLVDPDEFSPIGCWTDFMNAGGRFALTVVAVALAARGAARCSVWLDRWPRPRALQGR